jgi:hypothetical protein
MTSHLQAAILKPWSAVFQMNLPRQQSYFFTGGG